MTEFILHRISWAAVVALVAAACSLALYSKLLYDDKIGAASFVTLVCVTSLVCLVIYGFPRLKQLDLRNFKLTLEKIETVRKDIYAKEQDLKRVSLLLTDFIVTNGLWQNRFGSDETTELTKRWATRQAERILDAFHSTKNEKEHLLRFVRSFDLLDSAKEESERDKAWNNLVQRFRDELGTSE